MHRPSDTVILKPGFFQAVDFCDHPLRPPAIAIGHPGPQTRLHASSAALPAHRLY